MFTTISQVLILICGIMAVLLVNSPDKNLSKYACIFGLLCQPSWAYVTYMDRSWGIFALTFVYTYGWGKGFYHNWIKNRLVQVPGQETSSTLTESDER